MTAVVRVADGRQTMGVTAVEQRTLGRNATAVRQRTAWGINAVVVRIRFFKPPNSCAQAPLLVGTSPLS